MMFLGLSIGAWITLLVILFVIIAQLFTKMSTDTVYLIAIMVFIASGILNPDEAFVGLVAPATLFVLFFFVVVECMLHTGALHWITQHLFGKHHNMTFSLLRMMISTAVFSAFISNPSVGQILYQPVADWSRKHKITPSKMLLPVAFLIGMGGTCTIIGYPVNLIVFGFCEDMTGNTYNIFTPFAGGCFCTIICILCTLLFQRRIPNCPDPKDSFKDTKEFIVEMLVPSHSDAILKTIKELKFDQLEYGRLVSITRFDHEFISPVKADDYIFGGDRLVFSGQLEPLLQLRREMGFATSTKHLYDLEEDKDTEKKLQVYTIPQHSTFIGKKLIDTDFETQNMVTLVALMHEGKQPTTLPRETPLNIGDILLFEGKKIHISAFNNALVAHDIPEIVQTNWKTWVSIAAVLLIILLPALNIVPMISAVFIFMIFLCGIKCCTRSQAWSSINWSLIVMMTGAFSISTAMKSSGLAQTLSELIIGICGTNSLQATAVLVGTSILMTQFIFDASVVSILIPIGIQLSSSIGVDPLPFAMAILLGASCNFTTHISTAHMIMVYPLGGFKQKDIFKFGLPYCLIMFVAIMLAIKLFYAF